MKKLNKKACKEITGGCLQILRGVITIVIANLINQEIEKKERIRMEIKIKDVFL